MSFEKTDKVLRFGKRLISVINSVIILMTSLILAVTLGIILRDVYFLLTGFNSLDFSLIQNMANEVVFLFVYVEIVRSAIIAKQRPEIYVVALAEVGFIVSIRDVVRSSIMGVEEDLLLSSLSVLLFAIVLLIMYKYVVPSRAPPKPD
ncbi:MAG: hypothetical protein QXP68_02805 [Thermosphaera sp.]